MARKKLHLGFLVTVSGRWPRELPERRLADYGAWVKETFPQAEVTVFPRLVCTKGDVEDCVSAFRAAGADLVLSVYGAFTGDDVCCAMADSLRVPVILWAPREEAWVRQDRLYANALCSAAMNGASLMRIGAPHHILYGNKEEDRVKEELSDLVDAYTVRKSLRGMTLGLFGYRPTAFYNCAFDEVVIRRTFGINIEETDLKVVFDQMAALPEEEVRAEMERTSKAWDTSALPEGHLENHARLLLTLRELMPRQGYDYAAIKCWPEMGNLHTTPCAVLGRLADEGLNIFCEGDVDAGLAAAVQHQFTGRPPFICDLINLDEGENTLTFWHCGNAAPSLHDEGDGVTMCNHPLAGQGTAFWCALKPGPVTAARFTNLGGEYRLFLLRGEAVPTVRCTRGSMVNVRVGTPVLEVLRNIAEQGMSHHYSLVWEDTAARMEGLAKVLGVPVVRL